VTPDGPRDAGRAARRRTGRGGGAVGVRVKEAAPGTDILTMRWDRAVPVVCAALALPTALAVGTPLAAVTYLAGMATIVGGLWWGAARCSPGARRGWFLVAVTVSLDLVGDTLQRVRDALGVVAQGATPSDPIWLAGYLTLIAAVVVMLRGRGLDGDVVREIGLDALVLTAVSAIITWRLMILPGLAGETFDVAALVNVMYPVGDVVTVALGVMMLLAPGRRGPPGAMLITCLLGSFGMDCLYAVQATVLPGLDSERLDAALLVLNSLLAAAALHPQASRLARPGTAAGRARELHRWRVVLLGVALVAMCLIEALPARGGTLDGVMLGACTTVASVSIVVRFYGVVRDRELAQAALVHQATHDLLTGLPNRALLVDRLAQAALVHRDGTGPGLALLYLDLDGFKEVNDTWGHASGDALLRTVAHRLLTCVRPGDSVARMGGDEFVVLCPGAAREDAAVLAARIVATVRQEVVLVHGTDEIRVRIGVSVGVVTSPATDAGLAADPTDPTGPAGPVDPDALLRAADAAMYAAKSGGGGIRAADLIGRPRTALDDAPARVRP